MKTAHPQEVYRLTDYVPDPGLLRMLPEQLAQQCLAVPLRIEDGTLVVATANPKDAAALRLLTRAARHTILPLTATYPDVRAALDLAYGRTSSYTPETAAAELCLRLGFIHADHMALIQEKAQKKGQSFLASAESLGLISPADLAEATALLYHIPHIREKSLGRLVDYSALVPWELAQEKQVIPLGMVGGNLLLGSPGPIHAGQVREISEITRLPVQYAILPRDTWQKLYRRLYLRGELEENIDLEIARSLVRQGLLADYDLQNALSIQAQSGAPLEKTILTLGLVERREWFQAKAGFYRVSFHDLEKTPPLLSHDLSLLSARISPAVARALGAVALQAGDGHSIIGMAEPNRKRIRTIEQILGQVVETRLVDPQQLDESFNERRSPQEVFGINLPSPQEYALQLGWVTPLLVNDARNKMTPSADGEDAMVAAGLIDDIDYAELVGLHCDLPFVRLDQVHMNEESLGDLPRDIMTGFNCFPLFSTARQLWLAMIDPLDGAAIQEVERVTAKRVWPVAAPRSIVLSILDRYVAPQQVSEQKESIRIVERLVRSGLLTQLEASRALKAHKIQHKPLDLAIAAESTYTPDELTPVIASVLGVQTISLALQEKEIPVINPLGGQSTRLAVTDPVDASTAERIDQETAQKWCALPVTTTGEQVVVAFADPDFQPALADLQNRIAARIVPALAARHELEEAIQRILGHRNLGTYLLLEGIITRKQLNRALDLARRTGVRLGVALVNRRFITQAQLSQFIAKQSGLPFVELASQPIDEELARKIPANFARQHGILAIQHSPEGVTLAMTDPLDDDSSAAALQIYKQPILPVVVSNTDLDQALEKIFGSEYLAQSVSELIARAPDDSAYRVLSRGQQVFFVLMLALSAVWLFINHTSFFMVLNAIATFFYLVFSGYKLYLIYRALDKDLEVPVSAEELKNLKDTDLPVYSILIPVYHEAKMLPELLEAISRFDYPSTKLDIQVIMEEDDEDTIAAFHRWNPPSHFHGVVVPEAQPKTKPKACNYGLIHARGDYVVIYDAEDLPESDQLKKAIVAFGKVDPEVVCIQSKLNYYNHDQNLLTHWFTIEYSMWFDLFLPGLNASSAPIPLGGTSNHFRREALVEIAAWDPFNVTEDADLGIRLYKRGYKTVIIDSTTFEEANSQLNNWIRQRSRWIKGYIQTWLVHMRHPVRLWKEIGWKAFFGFQFVVGGNFLTALLNPIYWMMTTLWFIFRWHFIQQIFPPVIFYLGAICLFLGNFAFTYINVAGALRRGYYSMVKYALLSPFYWALASIGAWRGFLQLFTRPFYWEKTVHGLVDNPTPTNDSSSPAKTSQPK